jgi:hypothetical protein
MICTSVVSRVRAPRFVKRLARLNEEAETASDLD